MTRLRKRKLILTFVLLLMIVLAGCQNSGDTASSTSVDQGGSPSPTVTPASPANTPESSQPATNPSADTGSSPSASAVTDSGMGKVTAVRLADPKSGWIGGEGWIARTDDGGKNWQKQFQGAGTISQLFALNGQEAWAAMSQGSGNSEERSLLSTTDGGKHWFMAGKVPNSGFLHFVSGKEAFSANARTTDGGKTWAKIPVPGSIVGDAYFHDKDHGWAVTKGKDTIEVQSTLDGGHTWHVVMSRKSVASPNGAVIRSAGTNDAWIECIGDSGMSQTSYSVFHTSDGGKNWQTVIANSTAGAGPAPGFPMDYNKGPLNKGSKPGPFYVVNTKVAFIGGYCPACDKPNTVGRTNRRSQVMAMHCSRLPIPTTDGGLVRIIPIRP
jgi:photosystem II stability/assembly factor-like uncharacterized protein